MEKSRPKKVYLVNWPAIYFSFNDIHFVFFALLSTLSHKRKILLHFRFSHQRSTMNEAAKEVDNYINWIMRVVNGQTIKNMNRNNWRSQLNENPTR